MSEHSLAADSASEHDLAIRALEAEFGELFARMRRLYAAVARSIDPRLLPGQYKAFSVISHRGPLSVSGLAEALHVDKGQASRTVRELEELGLVARTPDPHDGRVSLLDLTAHGRERLEVVRDPNANALLLPLRDWNVADIRNFARLLHALSTAELPDSVVPSDTMGVTRPPTCEES